MHAQQHDNTLGTIAFIGGGNMASAVIGGLIRAGRAPASITVVEPFDAQRSKLVADFAVRTLAAADASLGSATLVVWAVKPQAFAAAAAPCAAHVHTALQLSVMAGIRCDAIARAIGADVAAQAAADRIVRSMPNTPALIGRGIAGLYATPGVTAAERAMVEQVLAPTGQTLWVDKESDLDAVTALSGSGPAYVFYLIEAMVEAAAGMGLSPAQGKRLALATLDGATALAAASTASPTTLREQVTSKGGTTHAAISALQAAAVGPAIVAAILAAQARARELGQQFG